MILRTDMRTLTTGIRSEKCVVRRFRRSAKEYIHKSILYIFYNILCTVNTQHTSRQDAIIQLGYIWLHVSAEQYKYFYCTLILFLVGLKMAGYGRNM